MSFGFSAATLFSLSLWLSLIPLVASQNPTVTISHPEATIVGISGDVERFSAIPFAQPPIESLRLKPPQPIRTSLGVIQANKPARSCPRLVLQNKPKAGLFGTELFSPSVVAQALDSPILQQAANAGEDCLTLDIYRPRGLNATAKLPVLFWIFGGGFELGSSSMYDGSNWIQNSVRLGQPIIMVAVNYRVAGFGFLAGKEILADGSTNLGLRDQRLGMEWVADNIEAFGGDPDKVTIWGESAGAISVFDQGVAKDGDNTYKGRPLWRGAIMNSGSVVPTDPVDCPKAQDVYDTVVKTGGCSGSSDTLSCLRSLSYEKFLNAANSVPGILSYTTVALSYLPRPDGTFLTDSPDQLGLQGKFARVPFILGDQEDEGTLFALPQFNITTVPEIVEYLMTYYFSHASEHMIEQLVAFYTNTTTWGSPFRTSDVPNNWYPQFKRLAAILGDLVFTMVRRASLEVAQSYGVKSWSYLASYGYGTPIMGTFHGSDLLTVWFAKPTDSYASRAFQAYYIGFVNNLDPNESGDSSLPMWPEWAEDRQLLNMNLTDSQLITDDFRQEVLDFLVENEKSFYY